MKRKNLGRAVLVLFLLLPALAVWWPLWFMGTGALMPLDELRAALGPVLQGAEGSAFWPLLPSWPTLQPLAELLLDTPQFFTMFWNTCAIVFPQVLGQVLVGAPAAWAFSRLRFRGRRALFTLYIVLMLMPFQVTMVSGYLVADAMGIMDTFWAIILPGVFSTFPVFIMAKGFDAVPIALLEAASIDGAGPLRTFFHIGVPLGVPGILSAAVLGFLEAWNAIEQPMTFLKTKALAAFAVSAPDRGGKAGPGHGGQPCDAGPGGADLPVRAEISGAGNPGQRIEGVDNVAYQRKSHGPLGPQAALERHTGPRAEGCGAVLCGHAGLHDDCARHGGRNAGRSADGVPPARRACTGADGGRSALRGRGAER